MNLFKISNLTVLAILVFLTTAQVQSAAIKTITVACGARITESVIIANDLNCPETTGYALVISGDNITVDGGGHKIHAPKASAAISAEGSGLKISNFVSTGNAAGFGLMAYKTPKLHVTGNDFSKNKIGVVVYTEDTLVSGVVIDKNKIEGSTEFGVRLTYGGSGDIKNPKITNNSFRNTNGTPIYVMASEFEITGSDQNDFWGSQHAYYLKEGTFSIHDIDFSQHLIYKVMVFIDSAKFVSVKNVNLTSRAQNICTEERNGIDFYRVGKVHITNVVSTAGDVGLLFETENGVQTEGDILDSKFMYHVRAGIALVSYDTTKYGKINIDSTGFCEARKDVYIFKGTKGQFQHNVQPTICPDSIDYSCNPTIPDDIRPKPPRRNSSGPK